MSQIVVAMGLAGLVVAGALRYAKLGRQAGRAAVDRLAAVAAPRSNSSSVCVLDAASSPAEVAECVALAGQALHGDAEALKSLPVVGALCLRCAVPAPAKLLAIRAMERFRADALAAAAFARGAAAVPNDSDVATSPNFGTGTTHNLPARLLPEGPLFTVLAFVVNPGRRSTLGRDLHGRVDNAALLVRIPAPRAAAGPLGREAGPLWGGGDALLLSHLALHTLLHAARGPAVGGVLRSRADDGYGPTLEELLTRAADQAAHAHGLGVVALQLEPRRSAAHIVVYRAARRCGFEPVLHDDDDPDDPPRSYVLMMRGTVVLWRRVRPKRGLFL